jgi:hypothetical protein
MGGRAPTGRFQPENGSYATDNSEGKGIGDLIDVSLPGQVHPFVLEPGALGMVSVNLDAPLPAYATITTYIDGTPGTTSTEGWLGLTLTEYVPAIGGSVGTITNDSEYTLDTLYLRIACFSANGDLLSVELVSSSRDSIPAGETSP